MPGQKGTDAGTVYRIATSRIGDVNIAVILESEADESERLAADVLLPSLDDVVVR